MSANVSNRHKKSENTTFDNFEFFAVLDDFVN